MSGWIKDYRKELESDIWQMPPMFHRVWQYLKYRANHSPIKIPNRDGTHTLIQRGELVTSYRHIARGVGYWEGKRWVEPHAQTVKRILDWLEKNSMIGVKCDSLGTHISIENYDIYQSDKSSHVTEIIQYCDTNVTPLRQSFTTNNNVKNEKNEKNEKKKTSNADPVHIKIRHLTITVPEHEKLVEEFGKVIVEDVYDGMENYAKLKNYVSGFKTAQNWCKRRVREGWSRDDGNGQPRVKSAGKKVTLPDSFFFNGGEFDNED